VVAADGVTPVAGASVQFTFFPAVAFSACGGSTNCTVPAIKAACITFVTVQSVGTMTVYCEIGARDVPNTATGAGHAYRTSSQLDLSLLKSVGLDCAGRHIDSAAQRPSALEWETSQRHDSELSGSLLAWHFEFRRLRKPTLTGRCP